MGRIKRKGESGNAKNFISRTQAVKKLQLSLPDFRKLCIWKGIYPREPRDKKKVSKNSTPSTTFYYTKDIQYLLHEPLLRKFRDQKALEKKISRAIGRGDVSDAVRLERNAVRPEKTGKPTYTLNHIIKERYPTFVDAVRDLDDCLSMLFLFANLPSTSTVPAKMIARCERLCLEFEHYLIVSNSLRKSFLSIKGIYYQANIQGEDVLWLVPYKFNQRVVGDVDFRIMGTFVEFYMALLGFVNYRLYTSVGLKYPPKFDQNKDDQGGELGALTLEGINIAAKQDEPKQLQLTNGESEHGPDPKVQAEVNKLLKSIDEGATNGDAKAAGDAEKAEADADAEEATDAIDKFEPAVEGGDILPQPSYSTNDPASLFSKCTFFLGRETPRQPLELILRAFGCKRIGWDAVLGDGSFTTDELDPHITHQIIDRPLIQAAVAANGDGEDNQTSQKLAPNQRVPGRIYVQPQWVWDCINDEELKDPNLYAPGAELPPHLSPFVKLAKGQYDPTMPLEAQQTDAEKLAADSDEEDEEDEDDEVDNDMDVDDENDEESEGFEEEADEEESDEEDSAAAERQRELEAELTGKPVKLKQQNAKDKKKADARKANEKKLKEEAIETERQKGMLPKKKRKLFEQMEYTNNKKSAEDEKLRSKRAKIEKAKGKRA